MKAGADWRDCTACKGESSGCGDGDCADAPPCAGVCRREEDVRTGTRNVSCMCSAVWRIEQCGRVCVIQYRECDSAVVYV
jgi:hypothetical protein